MENYLELPIEVIKNIKKEITTELNQDGSFFIKWSWLSEGFEGKPEDIAYVALVYSNLFDLYYTKFGWFGDSDYIITKKATPIKEIYHDLYPSEYETSMTYNEFLYTTFRVNEDAEINEKSISSEEKLPSSLITNGFKYSDDLDSKREEYTTVYTTLNGQKIDFADLKDVKNDITSVYTLPITRNEDFDDCITELINRFGITEEEGEDIMINYYNIPRPTN